MVCEPEHTHDRYEKQTAWYIKAWSFRSNCIHIYTYTHVYIYYIHIVYYIYIYIYIYICIHILYTHCVPRESYFPIIARNAIGGDVRKIEQLSKFHLE